jgi:hypothetical protein
MWTRKRKTIALGAGAALVCLLAAAGLSQPGRHSVQRLLAVITGRHGAGLLLSPAAASSSDVEQRARSHHGWSAAVLDAVQHGSITSYDRSGAITHQATLVVYRKYPDLLRVESTTGQTTQVVGFDGTSPWTPGPTSLTAAAARDIRQWLRCSPERIFLTRSAGAAYREPGRRVEDHTPPTPWQAAVDLAQPREYDQAELADLIGPLTPVQGPVDRRSVTYLIDRQTSLIAAARWMDPANPSLSAATAGVSLVETRVEFGVWRDVAGVQWPYEITHWSGGKVDFRVQLTSVQMNQNPLDSLFQKP